MRRNGQPYHTTIRVSAAQFEGHDNCLAAAAASIADEIGTPGYDTSARFEDDENRAFILLDVPSDDTYECAICAGYGTLTHMLPSMAAEIPHDANRDGLDRRRACACANCVAAGATLATDDAEECACGCGERTARMIRRLREQDRGTAESLGWAEISIAPMRVSIACVEGHEWDLSDYVDESSI
jgi:hypothetical protein